MSCCPECESGLKCCCGDQLSPCAVCAENTAENETLQSALDNFIKNFFGVLTKTEVDGVVTWVLPCGLETGLQNNPRLTDEGLACYFLRLFKDGITGLTGQRGLKGDAGEDGASGVSFLACSFVQPTVDGNGNFVCPTFDITVDDPTLLTAGMYVWIPGSGYYQVMQVNGTTVTVTIIVAADPALVTVPAGTVVIPAGPRGEQGIQGIQGLAGQDGQDGAKGDTGDQGPSGDSARATLDTAFNMPAVGSDTGVLAFSLELGLTAGQTLWVGGAGYMAVSTVVSETQATLTNLGFPGTIGPGTPVLAYDSSTNPNGWVYVAAYSAPADVSLLSWKLTVRLVSAAADIDLGTGGHLVIDGVTSASGDRVLVAAQTDPAENGIYVVANGAWTRATDADAVNELFPGCKVQVAYGDKFADTEWVQIDQVGAYIWTSPKTWVQSSSFVPAYGVAEYRAQGGFVPGMVTATVAVNRWYEIGTGGTFHWRTPDLANMDITSPAPANPKAQFKVTIPGTYHVSWNAECWPKIGASEGNNVVLGVLKKTGGGSFPIANFPQTAQCGGKLPTVASGESLVLAGSGLFVDLAVDDEIQLMAYNSSGGNQFYVNNGCFTAHRLL